MAEIRVTKPLDYKQNTYIITRESNAPLMNIMYSKGLASNEDYMTLEEVEAVTKERLGTFRNNTELEYFDEFQYFINVDELVQNFMFDVPNLISITLPPTVKRIGRACFGISSAKQKEGWVSKLKYIKGCKNVEYCGLNAFQACNELISIDFSSNLKTVSTFLNTLNNIESVGDLSGIENFDTVNGSAQGIMRICPKLTIISMPNMSIIPQFAFFSMNNLVSLDLDWYNIRNIDYQAFGIGSTNADKYNLIEKIPDMPNLVDLNYMGNQFQGCKNLKYVGDMPKVTVIPQYCFNLCTKLQRIGKLDEVTTLGISAFDCCTNLEYIELPKCNNVGKHAFNIGTKEEYTEKVNRTVVFGLPFEEITFGENPFMDCFRTTIICNGIELTDEQYQSLGATKPTA